MKHLKSILPRPETSTKRHAFALTVWAILFLSFSGTEPERIQSRPKDVTDARNETLKAFMLISTHWEKGREKIAYLREFETARKKITKL